jgi:hypothetical protein
VTIIKQTTNVTNYVTINNRIVNGSVDVHRIEAAAHTHIKPVHVREVNRPVPNAKTHAANSDVQVFRPTKKPQAASSTSKEMTRQQAITSKHQGTAIATPPNHQNPQQQRESEHQKQQEEQKQRLLRRLQQECQANPAACQPQ